MENEKKRGRPRVHATPEESKKARAKAARAWDERNKDYLVRFGVAIRKDLADVIQSAVDIVNAESTEKTNRNRFIVESAASEAYTIINRKIENSGRPSRIETDIYVHDEKGAINAAVVTSPEELLALMKQEHLGKCAVKVFYDDESALSSVMTTVDAEAWVTLNHLNDPPTR